MIYTIIAYKEQYRKQSQILIESFLKYVKGSANLDMLVIVTDDIAFYKDHIQDCIHVVDRLSHETGQFKANWKHLCLEECKPYALLGEPIVYLDTDCYFVDYVDDKDYTGIKDGLNAKLQGTHHPSTMDNQALVDTIYGLNPDRNQLYTSFIECAFIVKVDSLFHQFIQAWKQVCQEIDDKRLNHAGETYAMQIAALRCGLALNTIPSGSLDSKILRRCEKDSIGIAFR